MSQSLKEDFKDKYVLRGQKRYAGDWEASLGHFTVILDNAKTEQEAVAQAERRVAERRQTTLAPEIVVAKLHYNNRVVKEF